MYKVSAAYEEAIDKLSIKTRFEAKITLMNNTILHITDKDLNQGSCSINSKCVSNNDFEYGAVYMAEANLAITTDADRYSFYGAIIEPIIYVMLADGTWEAVPRGIFIVEEANRIGKNVSLKAYDRMILLDEEGMITFSSMFGKPYDLLSTLCTLCNIQMAQTKEEITALVNGTMDMGLNVDASIATARDILHYLAAITCTFVLFDFTGKLKLVPYAKEISYIAKGSKKANTKISDFIVTYYGFKTVIEEEEVIVADEEATGLMMTVEKNPFLQLGLEETKQELMNNILTDLLSVSYVPATFDLQTGNPAVELGDLIGVEDGTNDTINTYVMSYTYKYRGKHTIKGLGSNPKLNGAKSKDERALKNMESTVGEQEIVYYTHTNTKDFDVVEDSGFVKVISIFFAARKTTTAEFKAAILLQNTLPENSVLLSEQKGKEKVSFVDSAGKTVEIEIPVYQYNQTTTFPTADVTVKYLLDKVALEEFTPVETIRNGNHILNLMYTLPNVSNKSTHMFEVALKVKGCDLHIPKMNLIASLIGQGLVSGAVWDGTIDIDETIQDVFIDNVTIELLADNLETDCKEFEAAVISLVMPEVQVSTMIEGLNSTISITMEERNQE